MNHSTLLLVLGAVACIGCPRTEPLAPIGTVDQTLDLRAALSVADAQPVGITVDPDTGDRYLLDAAAGLFRIDGAQADLVLALADFPAADVPPRSEFTDVAALGDGQFAVLARGDGYLLDLDAGTLQQWFCYEPEWMEPEQEQHSLNLAYDPSTDILYSHAQTLQDGDVVSSQVGTFDAGGAGDLSWFFLDDGALIAGGAALEPDGQLTLGSGAALYRYRLGDTAPVAVGSLAEHGVTDIAGMVRIDAGRYLVVDGSSDQLFDLRVD